MMECTIWHDGRNWVASHAGDIISAPSLEELDRQVVRLLRQKGLLRKGEKIRVLMRFDNSTIPPEIRQYASHYFNRVIEVGD